MAKFDLHLHSNNSDGSDSPKELVEKVKKAGIEIFALTDHDTINGIEEIKKYTPEGFVFIRGIELTCKTRGIKCHILGYGIDTKNQELNELIEEGKLLRRHKLETRVKYLRDVWNIELTKEELNWLYSRQSVVKTHFANILVNRGLSDNNVDAMKKYLGGCKTGDSRFDGEKAIRTIVNAGGIPVWAHPLGGEGEEHLSEEEFGSQLKIMKDCGIQGLECFYSRYSIKETEILKKLAKENNLYISGGSDYHGENKTVELGALNTDFEQISSEEITLLKILNN